MTAPSDRPRIAWFCGNPTKDTLSSYCTELLVPLLRERFEIELFGDLSVGGVAPGVALSTMQHYLTAYRRHREAPFDLFFYQLEDGRESRAMRIHLGLIPGVVWVHDLVLADRGPEGLYTSPWERTVEQYLDPSASFLGRAQPPHQLWPQAYREVSLAPVLLLSSPWAIREQAQLVTKRLEPYPGGQLIEHLPVPVVLGGASSASPGDECMRYAMVASVHVDDRAYKILPALRDVTTPCHLTWLIAVHEVEQARALIAEFAVEDKVTLLEGRTFERWRSLVGESDVAVHLHRSPFGHLAPYLQISLAAGRPVIVSDAAEGSHLPKDVMFSIVPGMHEAAQMRALLEELAKVSLAKIGKRGREFVRAQSDVNLIALKLGELFMRSIPVCKGCLSRWNRLGNSAADSLLQEVTQSRQGCEDQVAGAEQILMPVARELGWTIS